MGRDNCIHVYMCCIVNSNYVIMKWFLKLFKRKRELYNRIFELEGQIMNINQTLKSFHYRFTDIEYSLRHHKHTEDE